MHRRLGHTRTHQMISVRVSIHVGSLLRNLNDNKASRIRFSLQQIAPCCANIQVTESRLKGHGCTQCCMRIQGITRAMRLQSSGETVAPQLNIAGLGEPQPPLAKLTGRHALPRVALGCFVCECVWNCRKVLQELLSDDTGRRA